MTSKRRRFVWRGVLSLPLGLLLSLAVAWGGGVIPIHFPGKVGLGTASFAGFTWSTVRVTNVVGESFQAMALDRSQGALDLTRLERDRLAGEVVYDDNELPKWAWPPAGIDAGLAERNLAATGGRGSGFCYGMIVGWPWRCASELNCSLTFYPSPAVTMKASQGASTFFKTRYPLPSHFHPTGLILDSLFYSPIGFFFLTGTSTLRRRILERRRRSAGQCPNCTYDRTGLAAGSPCPECGFSPRGV